MKRKLSKAIVATAVCTAMLGMTCQAAFDGNIETAGGSGQTVEGTNEVENPVYRVVVPTQLEFAVDAFEQKGEGQIWSENMSMINKSNVPVKVGVAIKLSTTNDVAFAATPDAVVIDDSTKSVYVEAKVADGVTETKAAGAKYQKAGVDVTNAYKSTAVEGNYYLTNTIAQTVEALDAEPTYVDAVDEMTDVASLAITYPAAEADTVKYGLGTTDTNITFALGAADYINWYGTADSFDRLFKTTAANNKGSASWRFSGVVNPNVVWTAGDFKATAVYTINGLATSVYDALTPVPNAHQLMITEEEPVFTASTVTKGLITYTEGAGDPAIDEITAMTMVNKGTSYDALAQSTVDTTAKTIQIGSTFVGYFSADTEATITYKNKAGETKTVTVTVKCV